MPYKRTGITALFSVQGTCSGTCLFLCRWNGQGTLACPAGAPFLGKKWGKEPQREEVLPSGLPSLVGVWGETVLLTCYLACGPPSERSVTARPPAGRAGNVGRCPLGEGRE